MAGLRNMWNWLRRCGRMSGYGIQSPTAYRFVRSVIGERSPYYAYDDLRQQVLCDARRRKQLELYLRLSNDRQKQPWVIVADDAGQITSYVQAGCRQTQVRIVAQATADDLLAHVGRTGMVVVEAIGTRKDRALLWRQMLTDTRPTMAFDLSVCGILFLAPAWSRQVYELNF